jgi:hypothetical protein
MNIKTLLKIFPILCMALLIFSCKKESSKPVAVTPPPPTPQLLNTVPEFFLPKVAADYGKMAPDFMLIANSRQSIAAPQDLDFNPLKPEQLWVVNQGTINTGGSTVMLTNPGSPTMQYDYRQDGNAWHFMLLPSALAFSTNGNWATSPGALDANHNGSEYTGPALWSSDLSIYAKPSGGNGSHLDMVHQSPYSMGIASDTLNKFWAFDGYNGNIVSYDFGKPHAPGGADHSAAKVERFTEAKVRMDYNVPSHLILDKKTGWLYVASTAYAKIYRLNTKTGSKYRSLTPYANEPLTEYSEIRGATWEVFADANMKKVCGIEISGNRLFVSDNSTGDIAAFDLTTKAEIGRINTDNPGICGIKLGPDGKIWYVNSKTSEVYRIDPK